MYLVFFRSTDNNFFLMTRLMLFFKKTFMQNIYKLLSLYISSFSSDIHDVETSFFLHKKINTDIWPILVTLCFLGEEKYNHKSWEYGYVPLHSGQKWAIFPTL